MGDICWPFISSRSFVAPEQRDDDMETAISLILFNKIVIHMLSSVEEPEATPQSPFYLSGPG